jgi:hypothetical protein
MPARRDLAGGFQPLRIVGHDLARWRTVLGVKPGRIWVVCCFAGVALGLAAGWLFSLTIPLCEDICTLPWPNPEYRRRMVVRTFTLAGLVGGVLVSGTLHLWWSHLRHVRYMSTGR